MARRVFRKRISGIPSMHPQNCSPMDHPTKDGLMVAQLLGPSRRGVADFDRNVRPAAPNQAEIPMTTATATALINAFAAASGTGAWPSLNRATLAKQLNSKLATPDSVNQAQTPFCGAAAFVRALVISKPDDYAQAAIDLFNTGEAKIGSLSIKPGNTTRNSAPQKSTDQADWLMLAGIRDSGNTLLSAAGLLGGNAAGITLPGTLAEWFTSAGFTVINKCDVLQTIPVVRACQITEANSYRSGYHVILFIDENVMEATNQADETSMYPDHWV